MWGGPAHQDTWDLKPHAPAEVRGEFLPIATSVPGIEICEHFPLLARRTDKLAIVRSMTHEDVNHTTATHNLLTGQPSPPLECRSSPRLAVARLGARQARPRPRSLAALRHDAAQARKRRAPLRRGKPRADRRLARAGFRSADDRCQSQCRATTASATSACRPRFPARRLDDRRALLAHIDAQRRAIERACKRRARWTTTTAAPSSSCTRPREATHSISPQEPDAFRDRYGRNPHGQSVLQARRLVERGVPLVTVFWPSDGIKNVSVYWDTHSRNFRDLKTRLMPAADQAFSALLDDLQSRGLLDETLVVWTGEFGRTPRVGQRNSDAGAGRDGRDHWPNCFTSVLAGAGIRGGQVYGSSDRHAAYPASNAVHPVDLIATVNHCLGIPPRIDSSRSARPASRLLPGELHCGPVGVARRLGCACRPFSTHPA